MAKTNEVGRPIIVRYGTMAHKGQITSKGCCCCISPHPQATYRQEHLRWFRLNDTWRCEQPVYHHTRGRGQSHPDSKQKKCKMRESTKEMSREGRRNKSCFSKFPESQKITMNSKWMRVSHRLWHTLGHFAEIASNKSRQSVPIDWRWPYLSYDPNHSGEDACTSLEDSKRL